MKQSRLFYKKDIIIIFLFFILYMIGYAWLIEPKKETERRTERKTMLPQKEIPQTRTEKRQLKSLSADWPLDLDKYFYTIDIDPGYEMEDEEYDRRYHYECGH